MIEPGIKVKYIKVVLISHAKTNIWFE